MLESIHQQNILNFHSWWWLYLTRYKNLTSVVVTLSDMSTYFVWNFAEFRAVTYHVSRATIVQIPHWLLSFSIVLQNRLFWWSRYPNKLGSSCVRLCCSSFGHPFEFSSRNPTAFKVAGSRKVTRFRTIGADNGGWLTDVEKILAR